MKKTVLPLLVLCACIICSCFTVRANAETACTIRGEEVVASPNSEVTMVITIENNPGICGMELMVSYGEGVTLIGAESGEAFSALTYGEPSYFRNPTPFLWDSENVEGDEIQDGEMLILTFRVEEGAEGDVPVELTCKDSFDGDLNTVEPTTVNGCITVISYKPGDVNGDNKIITQDITLIRRYISDGRTTDPNGYNVKLNENAADVNADSKITTMDITLIRRFISDGRITDPNGYNITLLPGKMSCKHTMEHTPAKEPTCTEAGNTEYWYCPKCETYFADANGKYEVLYANTQLAPDHTYEEQWSYDEYSHWYEASCDHKDNVKDMEDHNFENHVCSVCGAPEMMVVTFVDNEGAVIDTQYVDYGTAATAPQVPERLGYVFDGWDRSFDAVTEDVTVTAQYTKARIVTFADTDGTVLKQESVRDGEAATAYQFGASDIPPAGYERAGWDKAFDHITEDTVVYVNYVKKAYSVRFYMPDGTLIETQSVEHGAQAVEPACDEHYFDWNTQKMGKFSGWSASLKDIRCEQDIYAEYNNECDQPVISIDTTGNNASIKMYAPAGCYLYAIDFGFDWSGNISILSCEKNDASNLYKGNNGAANIDYNNKYNTFHYTWTNAAGVKLEGAYTTVLDIRFVTDGGQVLKPEVLKLMENCSIIFSTKQTGNMSELETVTPIAVMK